MTRPHIADGRSRTCLGTTARCSGLDLTGRKRPHDASSLAAIRIILRSTGASDFHYSVAVRAKLVVA